MSVAEGKETEQGNGVDESLYSRQIYVIGAKEMMRLSRARVLLSGLNGLGVEIAKNIILAGVKSVTLHDDEVATVGDLGSQFFLSEADVGKNRAAASLGALQELNEYVTVDVLEGSLEASAACLGGFDVVVMVDKAEASLVAVDDYCHANGKKFLATGSHGVAGYAFNDFGPAFTVNDATGENPKAGVVVDVTQGNPGVVTVAESTPHDMADGDKVSLSGLEGMEELAAAGPHTIKVINQTSFSIGDTTAFSPHVRGGYFAEVKQPCQMVFKPLRESLENPTMETTNYIDFDRPAKLHALARGLWRYRAAHGGSGPVAGDETAAAAVSRAAAEAWAEARPGEAADEALFGRLAQVAGGRVNPLAAIFGGIVGQEVIKACTGKFTPIHQWVHLDFAETLPQTAASSASLQPRGSRHDASAAVYGWEVLERLQEMRVFLVGCGALGCEFLKNFALMGIATGEQGEVTVTDMDSIERSNLNRQFLFRSWDVGSMKSEVAAAASVRMNGAMRVRALTTKVAPETEDVFNEEFWSTQSAVVTALDNVQARQYVDSRCVFFGRPLIDSGTLGTKAHCQPIVPGHSLSYNSEQDAPAKDIPVCTLKTFPNLIEHTIQWARDLFEELFHNGPEEANQYLKSGTAKYTATLDRQRSLKLQRATVLHRMLVSDRPTTFADCIRLARGKFDAAFDNNIRQLLHKFPEDMVSGDPPKAFWSGARKPPSPLPFDAADREHVAFVVAATHLFARVFGIAPDANAADIARVAAAVEAVPFRADDGVKIAATEEEAKEMAKAEEEDATGIDEATAALLAAVPKDSSVAGLRLTVEEFEKDDDGNHHIDFITACSNLRARNYRIPEASRMETKRVAGRIVPAIATTTALATGMVMVELLKTAQAHCLGDEEDDGKPCAWPLPRGCLGRFRSGNFNLAINSFAFFEPLQAEQASYKKKGVEVPYTLWDHVDVEGDVLLRDLVLLFEREYGYELSSLSTRGGNAVILYSSLLNADTMAPRMNKPISQVVKEVTEQPVTTKYLLLEADVDAIEDDDAGFDLNDSDDEEVELPAIRIRIR